MKKLLLAVMAAAALAMTDMAVCSCDGRKSVQDTDTTDSLAMDTTEMAMDTTEMDLDEYGTEVAFVPQAADELFDDFLFNFADNKQLQLSRIRFPLKVTRDSNETSIEAHSWKMERFFMRQDFYTIIFDNMRQMEAVNDTTVNHAVVEKIFLDKNTITQYVFDKENGKWMMNSMNHTTFNNSPNASFLKFYNRFVNDSTFQVASINDPLKFCGPDPDDDFSTMEGLLLPEQWPSFAPELPEGMIYNIIYGKQGTEPNSKIFVIRGIANGLETELQFKRKSGDWVLTELTM